MPHIKNFFAVRSKVNESAFSSSSAKTDVWQTIIFGGYILRNTESIHCKCIVYGAGISRGMLSRIEKADPKCEIGATFEVARIVGVTLFEEEPSRLTMQVKQVEEKLSLLPKSARKVKTDVIDDF